MTQKYDCKGDGCDECKVCKRLEYLDWVSSVAFNGPREIEHDAELDAYIAREYPT